MSVLQAPFELVHKEYKYEVGLEASSPPSSPCSLFGADSSPPSSPANYAHDIEDSDAELDSVDVRRASGGEASVDASPCSVRRVDVKGKGKLVGELDASPQHPFSASTRAVKRPPDYSKDGTRPKMKRQRNEPDVERYVFEMMGKEQATRLHERDNYMQSTIPGVTVAMDGVCDAQESEVEGSLARPSHDPEHVLWEETIAQAVDSAASKIDLSGQGLTYISPKVGDLSKLVVIRDNGGPARELAPRRTCSKSTNSIVFGAGRLGEREDEIHLYLANNKITRLPNELFNVDALVALSLRGNNLTEIPPLICQLRNLRELNVAYNKLRYLPSEIMALNLKTLRVDPNPFEENPYVKSKPTKDRWYGPIERKYTIVPLVELALRVLLAPSAELFGLHDPTASVTGARRQETVLEYCYDLPLQSISPALRETLSSCVPGSIAAVQSLNAAPALPLETRQQHHGPESRPCVSVCPSPAHLDISVNDYRRPVYVTHAEERRTWEKYVAGQRIGGEAGIPLRWRGCRAGCLDLLEKDSDDSSQGDVGCEEDWSVGMEVDGEKLKVAASHNVAGGDFETFDSGDINLDD